MASLVLSILTLIALIVYAYFTYIIAKDVSEPFVSFFFWQIENSPHLGYVMSNRSKLEVEVFGKFWIKANDMYFDFKDGFYGDKSSWIVQPFTEVKGGFELKDITNEEGIKLEEFVRNGEISEIKFHFQVNYRKVGSNKWRKSSPQKYIYKFDDNRFWLDV